MAIDVDGESMTAAEDDSGEFVRALARGLAVIEAFDQHHSTLTLSEVAKRTGVSRATARRLLHTLSALGYAAQNGRRFALRPKVLNLGIAYLSSFNLPGVALPFMEELVAQVQESCSLAVLDGSDIVYVARVPTRRIMSIDISIGTKLPAAMTSMGRVLLAALPDPAQETFLAAVGRDALRSAIRQVRQQGWALVDQELEEGLRAIAVPITGRQGAVIAAMNLSANATRVPNEQLLDRFLPLLQKTADAVSQALQFS
jgi:IclR family pca regulon transcriptional regulator